MLGIMLFKLFISMFKTINFKILHVYRFSVKDIGEYLM